MTGSRETVLIDIERVRLDNVVVAFDTQPDSPVWRADATPGAVDLNFAAYGTSSIFDEYQSRRLCYWHNPP